MKRLRVVIADDEREARRKLVRLLGERSDVEIVAEAANGREAIVAMRAHRPDLVLLDVEMPAVDGFETLEDMHSEPSPKIVFVTAFDQYAMRAFEVRAFDYVLKPVEAGRLGETLDRVQQQLEVERAYEASRVGDVLRQLQPETGPVATAEASVESFVDRVCIRSLGRTQFIDIAEVEWIEAYGNYVRLHTTQGRVLFRETMRHLEGQLDPAKFARVHRSAIVSLSAVREMRPCASGGDYLIFLKSGVRLRLARSHRPELDCRLGRRQTDRASL